MVYWPDGFLAPVGADEVDELEKELDDNIMAALPKDCVMKSIVGHGTSRWSFNHRIEVTLPSGECKYFFLKVVTGDVGAEMSHAEFEGVKALHAVIPENTPTPIAWGTYKKDPDRHFYLASFHDMTDWPPSIEKLVAAVTKLHANSESPTGKFGFHVTTFCGTHKVDTQWSDSWQEVFTRQFKGELEWEEHVRGKSQQLDEVVGPIFEKVIPRLLGPLQMAGRSIKPTLCHGDLWHGNVGVDVETDELILYDPCAFYAHHEFDLSCWRAPRYTFTAEHREEYFNTIPPSEPREEADDRNALYRARQDISVSAQWPENTITRNSAIEEMRYLISKYGRD